MTATRYTPGPWELNKSDWDEPIYIGARNGANVYPAIASIVPLDDRLQQEANADLIAVAPEMAACLASFAEIDHSWFRTPPPHFAAEMIELSKVARAVLKKGGAL